VLVTVHIPLTILMMLTKMTKLNKIDEYYDQIKKKVGSR